MSGLAERRIGRLIGFYTALAGLACTVIAGMVGWYVPADVAILGRAYWPLVFAFGVVVLTGCAGTWWMRYVGSSSAVDRMTRRALRTSGQATQWMIRRKAGRQAMRKKMKHLRPSLRRLPLRQRMLVPTHEIAAKVARVGGSWIYTSIEEIIIIFGGPRMGKSGTMACQIIDAPGAVVCTSTRADLLDTTGELRAKKGPIYVYNPAGVGDDSLVSTISFDPLMGCDHGPTAYDRAGDLLQGTSGPSGDQNRDFWTTQGRGVLSALMHAAALGGFSMRDVQNWVASPTEPVKNMVIRVLRNSADPSYETQALQFFENNHETRSSISTTIMPALSWLADPTAVATTENGTSFDVDELIEQRGTVYMIATQEHQHVVPLLTAAVAHIARSTRRRAGGRRLDPSNLTLALDEAAIICPVPLPSWTSDMGGMNVKIIIAAQSQAQLRERYGDDGAAAILNNAGTLTQFGAGKHDRDLESVSKLTGERSEKTVTTDKRGRVTARSERRVPVLSQAQISQLAPFRCLVMRTGMLPVLATAPMVWNHPAVRAHKARKALSTAYGRLRAFWLKVWVRTESVRTESRLRAGGRGEGPHPQLPPTHPDFPRPTLVRDSDNEAGSDHTEDQP